jgi:hypothetical protein
MRSLLENVFEIRTALDAADIPENPAVTKIVAQRIRQTTGETSRFVAAIVDENSAWSFSTAEHTLPFRCRSGKSLLHREVSRSYTFRVEELSIDHSDGLTIPMEK